MNTRILGSLALITLILTSLWLVLMIVDLASAGPLLTYAQVLAHVSQGQWTYTLTYLNAGLFTLAAMALMAGLYQYCQTVAPAWSRVGLVFIPVYGTLNLVAYLSQITLVPALLAARAEPETQIIADLLLQESLQLLPGSLIGFLNGLAYAILGIPSLIYGLVLLRERPALKAAGVLLILNALTCLLGITGYLLEHRGLSSGVVFGGVLFWLALFPLTFSFLPKAKPAL